MKSKCFILKKEYILSASDDSVLIIPTSRENSGLIFEIDATGKEILNHLKKKKSFEQLLLKIKKEYAPAEHKKIEKSLTSFLQQLVKQKIVKEI